MAGKRHGRGMLCVNRHLEERLLYHEDEGNTTLRLVGNYLPINTA